MARRDDPTLPLYSILVPLYREAEIVPGLVRALLSLEYPRDRLDIKLVAEADDAETVEACKVFAEPQGFEIVCVPPSLPRTKPKAANYALRRARGDYLVIYDAEDRPEPDQLLKAVGAFRSAPRTVACLQARLAFHNHDRWLTKSFAIDYFTWFGSLLPGLEKLNVPMPLGGTSNHFRTAVLREIGAWDPFNVTEDADIGLRLAQLGYRTAMLDSTTWEEAPERIDIWIKQRSRWLKGYMQTWLVHSRNAGSLTRQVGLGGFLAFQLFIGGAVLSALVNPILWGVFLLSCVLPIHLFGDVYRDTLGYISAAGALGSNGLLTYLAVSGTVRRGDTRLAPYGLTVFLYWLLISVAAYRGMLAQREKRLGLGFATLAYG
ncbi:MAG: glycosyltransferase [Rhizomicrobium sp.]